MSVYMMFAGDYSAAKKNSCALVILLLCLFMVDGLLVLKSFWSICSFVGVCWGLMRFLFVCLLQSECFGEWCFSGHGVGWYLLVNMLWLCAAISWCVLLMVCL